MRRLVSAVPRALPRAAAPRASALPLPPRTARTQPPRWLCTDAAPASDAAPPVADGAANVAGESAPLAGESAAAEEVLPMEPLPAPARKKRKLKKRRHPKFRPKVHLGPDTTSAPLLKSDLPLMQLPMPWIPEAWIPILDLPSVDHHYYRELEVTRRRLNLLLNGSQYEAYTLHDLATRPEVPHDMALLASSILSHRLFFRSVNPSPLPPGAQGHFGTMVDAQFGSQKLFKSKLVEVGMELFGSGFVWVLVDKDLVLHIASSEGYTYPPKHTPHLRPVACIDLFEHAYYSTYRNDRKTYLTTMVEHLDWLRIDGHL